MMAPQQDSINANAELVTYQVPLIYAFPQSLAVVQNCFFEYDCTPWLSEPIKDLSLLWKIIDVAHEHRKKGESSTPIPHIGNTSLVHLYAVFPHVGTIGKTDTCPVFRKWHDEVMRPAFEEAFKAAGHAYAEERPPSHQLAVMNSGFERVEMNRPNAPLNPVTTKVSERNLSTLWDATVKKTRQSSYEEFADVFLAVVFDPRTPLNGGITIGSTVSKTRNESLEEASNLWNLTVNMRYVPKGNIEYRVESTWRA